MIGIERGATQNRIILLLTYERILSINLQGYKEYIEILASSSKTKIVTASLKLQ